VAVLNTGDVLGGLRLVDHHCHSVRGDDLDRPAFEALLTEAGVAPVPGGSTFDTPLGVAVRRWCAPVLDLPAHAAPQEYLARRAELGAAEANRRLLAAAGASDLLLDSYRPPHALAADALAAASGARVHRVLRLETVAEQVAETGVPAVGFPRALIAALAEQAAGAVALKSVAAYRTGLDLDPTRPEPAEVAAAAGAWLARGERAAAYRLDEPVLVRFLLWAGVDLGLPLQLHTGFGDPDLRLHRSDPALLGDFCAAVAGTGTRVLLLHCYPYHRQAAYLASVYPHVYLDVGLALNHVGAGAPRVLAEALELAPFGKLLYSSDAFGLAELYHLGAVQFRRALGGVLDRWVGDGDMAAADAERYATMIGAGNARRVYDLAGR
jgi:predicted TIM-barrel fold metal-dependent hydrolase